MMQSPFAARAVRRSASALTAGAVALAAALLAAGCADGGLTDSSHRAGVDLDNPDKEQAKWVEDTPPPPPAYDLRRLIDIDAPGGSSVKVGIDPHTITINLKSGVVRYVVVARGTSAINAMYEGIRCSTGEFRTYARQVHGQPWNKAADSDWRSMSDQTGALVRHPLQLAQGGICDGPSITSTTDKMIRLLQAREMRPDLYQ